MVGLVLAAAGSAHAQSPRELERARTLFRQGLSLEAAGNWSAALAKFQEVGQVKLTPQVRFHTGRCNEALGRLSEALGEYRLAEYEATEQGIPELADIAAARQALEGRVPKLVIRRGEGASTARVELDGVEFGEAQVGQPVAVDPGPHSVVARLAGGRQLQQDTVVKERETTEVVITFPVEAQTAEVPPGDSAAAGADTGAVAAPPARSVLPWIAGGVGVAGLVGAGVFYALRAGAQSDLDGVCRGSVCPRSAEDLQSKGETYTTLTYVSLGVGVVGLGAAAALFLTAPSGASSAVGPVMLPVDVAALPGGAALTFRGRY